MNLDHLRRQLAAAARRSGRDPAAVRLVAVTKTVGMAEIAQAAALGLRSFGENRIQDAREKVRAYPQLAWHFIGHLQSNKAREAVRYYAMIHSVDRLSLAEALQKQADRFNRIVEILVQVNVSGEKSKYGLPPGELPALLTSLDALPRLKVRGLMTLAPLEADPGETRPVFRALRELRDRCARPGLDLAELSMGMSNDFTVAIEEGATMIRVGGALFKAV